MILVLHIAFAVYLLWLLILLFFWMKLLKADKPPVTEFISVRYSVIIPARNEAQNLPKLLASILDNDFPKSNYELIVVDDHSDDDTKSVLQEFDTGLKYLKLTDLQGKKAALTAGIKEATGDVIITTDADCVVRKQWLRSIANYFERKEVILLSGAVSFNPLKNTFHKLQAIEFASLIGTGASSIAMQMPNMCNGANLAFRKEAFFKVNGYSGNEHFASGDDEFLLHKIDKAYVGGVYFNTYNSVEVSTKPLNRISDFIQQRKRWASKWKLHRGMGQAATAVFVGMVNLSVAISVAVIFLGNDSLVIPLGIKVVLETVYLKQVLKFLRIRVSLIYFILIQIIYPFYVVYFAVVANLAGYKWKGRSY